MTQTPGKFSAKEEWRPVAGYEGWYDVSNWGRVKRVRRGRSTYAGKILKGSIGGKYYLQVGLYKDGIPKAAKVHQLVAAMFIGPCPAGKELNHKDGVKTNNHVSNLEYVTHTENQHHASVMGLYVSQEGEDNTGSKLTEEDVRCIWEDLKSETRASIARRYNVCKQTICNIAARITWRHLRLWENANA